MWRPRESRLPLFTMPCWWIGEDGSLQFMKQGTIMVAICAFQEDVQNLYLPSPNLSQYWWWNDDGPKSSSSSSHILSSPESLPSLSSVSMSLNNSKDIPETTSISSSGNRRVTKEEENLIRALEKMSSGGEAHPILDGFKFKIVKGGSTGKKVNYQCQYKGCSKIFPKAWNFLDHVRMHEKIKPFQWKICLKRYTQKGNLYKHSRQHKFPLVEERKCHKCDFCSQAYTEKYNLKVRMLIIFYEYLQIVTNFAIRLLITFTIFCINNHQNKINFIS